MVEWSGVSTMEVTNEDRKRIGGRQTVKSGTNRFKTWLTNTRNHDQDVSINVSPIFDVEIHDFFHHIVDAILRANQSSKQH
jgi:hypothetical protein